MAGYTHVLLVGTLVTKFGNKIRKELDLPVQQPLRAVSSLATLPSSYVLTAALPDT